MAESPDLAKTARQLLLYSFTVVLGIALHGTIVLPCIYYSLTNKSPLAFVRGLTPALMTAFGTDSSAATLPVTILCCKNFGISNEATPAPHPRPPALPSPIPVGEATCGGTRVFGYSCNK